MTKKVTLNVTRPSRESNPVPQILSPRTNPLRYSGSRREPLKDLYASKIRCDCVPIPAGAFSAAKISTCIVSVQKIDVFHQEYVRLCPHSCRGLLRGKKTATHHCFVIQVGFATDRRAGSNGSREVSAQREWIKVCGALCQGGPLPRNFP